VCTLTVSEQEPAPALARPASSEQNWFGIVALVTGLLGLGVIPLTFGILGVRAARQGRANNRGMSVAGVVLGALGVLVWVAALVITLVVWADLAGASGPPVPTQTPLAPPPNATRYELVPTDTSDATLGAPVAAYLSSRVNATVTVKPDGRTILVVFPHQATDAELAALTANPGVQFRPVVNIADPAPSTPETKDDVITDSPSWAGDPDYFETTTTLAQFANTNCTTPKPVPTPGVNDAAVECAADGSAKYLLGASVLSSADVAKVSVDGSNVTVTFTDAGSRTLTDLTTRLTSLTMPSNQMAVSADGIVWSAPQVAAPIAGGTAVVNFGDDPTGAQKFAGAIAFQSHAAQYAAQVAAP